jgi:hypothetical protein
MILFDDWGLIGLDDYLITCLPAYQKIGMERKSMEVFWSLK